MGLIAKETSGSGVDPIPEGVYIGVCDRVLDLGTHYDRTFNKQVRKILLQWELPELRIEVELDRGRRVDLPRAISKRYTLSLHEKSHLRHDLESWRGKKFTAQELQGFDLKTILGAAGQLSIVHGEGRDGKVYAAVAAIMALPKGVKKPKPENELQFFSFDDGGPIPPGLPEWMVDVMQESKEFKGETETETPDPEPEPETPAEDDVPF